MDPFKIERSKRVWAGYVFLCSTRGQEPQWFTCHSEAEDGLGRIYWAEDFGSDVARALKSFDERQF